MKIGYGWDSHEFKQGIPLKIGGVTLPHSHGLGGHSDGDALLHAITDALLGAVAAPDIGSLFSPSDPKWKGADSLAMLARAVELVHDAGFVIGNIDCTIVTERPKISPYRDQMQENLATIVNAPVSVKASRAEGLGALGRVEGAACWAVALLEQQQ